MGGRLIGCEGNGLAQEPDGFVVLMLVDELGRPQAQRIRRLELCRGCRGTRPEKQHRHARGQ